MNRSMNLIIKIGISFTGIALIFIGVAILSVKSLKQSLKRPLVYDKYSFEDLEKAYTADRSDESAKRFQQNLTNLSETGSCIDCDLLTTRNDKESEKRDIFAAIQNAKLRGKNINLSGANLFMAQLPGIDLSGADLHDANLLGADLTGANLSKANLQGANLYGAKLNGANLEGADLSEAYISRAHLIGANLTNATLHQTRLFYWTNMQQANFANAQLTETFIDARATQETNFTNANFFGARIISGFDQTANLTDAKLDNPLMQWMRVLPIYFLIILERAKLDKVLEFFYTIKYDHWNS